MTDADLDRLRQLHEAATPEDWPCVVEWCEADRELIPAARNALPLLLAEIDRLRAENAELRAGIEAEREACARVADRLHSECTSTDRDVTLYETVDLQHPEETHGAAVAAEFIAATIRARKPAGER